MNRIGVIILLFLTIGCKNHVPEYVAVEFNDTPTIIDFNIHVKPILSDKCFSCHGPDKGTRKAELRLDTEDGIFQKTSKGTFPIKPKNLNKSEAIKRILTEDKTYLMPPPDAHLDLTAKEKAILVKWVQQGAHWEKHWAFIPLKKPETPVPENSWSPKNEIDLFIHSKLKEVKLHPNRHASKEQLLRRLSIDLKGTPPTIEEIHSFVNSNDPDAYEKLVDQMLASKSHAERLTLEWLDVARYSDSHGYHADGSRLMWPWRDWVIKSFYENKPYNEFVTEQLAGDLMPNATKEQILATGFNRNHPTTAEGGVIDEEFRVEYVTNRTNTFGTAFLGLTMECAKCHDHKFDPISQKDYFQLYAYFNNVRELGMTSNDGNAGPFLLLTDDKLDAKINHLKLKIDSVSTIEQSLKAPFIKNSKFKASAHFKKTRPIIHHGFENISKRGKKKIVDYKLLSIVNDEVTLENGVSNNGANFQHHSQNIELTEFDDYDKNDPFSIPIWVYPESRDSEKTMTIIGNSSGKVKGRLYRGWDLIIESSGQVSGRLISSLPSNYIHVKTNDTIPLNKWTHLLMTYDGSSTGKGLNIYTNGVRTPQKIEHDYLYKSIIPADNFNIRLGKSYRGQTGDNGVFTGKMDELSIYDYEILPLQISHVFEQSKKGQDHFAWKPSEIEYVNLQSKLKSLRNKNLSTLDTITEVMVMKEMAKPRKTYILNRGVYNEYGEEVTSETPQQLSFNKKKYAKNRLGLSQWLFDPNNPLAARVTVNRYWQMIFGKGLVVTTNDFGNQGALPSHLKLLDWLSVEFIESGWDVRKLIKMVVMSSTYQQSSTTTKEIQNIDPDNNLLARSPSYRLQAEFIRDNALHASGLLNKKVGGESVHPYQPKGLWIEKGNFSKDLLYYVQDHDEKQYRKSMYTFNKRTSPPPFMEIFDMPGRENCIVSRERTNTPLQALSLMNDPQFVEASKVLAYRMIKEGGDSINDKIKTGFLLTLSRDPKKEELQIMTDLYYEELENFKKDKSKASSFLAVGDYELPKDLPISETAAMTIVANTLFNMDEMYTKR